ncbi:MAG: 4-hydroxybenzoate 3-monooxygenase [Gammaproteobacteria bacterium]
MKTQVGIIGAGPSGLLLSRLLSNNGIDNVVLERQSRAYVEARIRAGVLESITVDLLDEAGVGTRMHAEGLVHQGFNLSFDGQLRRIDMAALTGGRSVMIYGQTEITKDLFEAHEQASSDIICETNDVQIHDFDTDKPRITFKKDGRNHEISCELIAGCDGFHGVCRESIPRKSITEFEKLYPFGWLGLLSDTPPIDDELIYVNDERGFALCSMRSRSRSRYYVQCSLEDTVDEWPDNRFWDELQNRLPADKASDLITGPSIEKSIAPLRSFVAEPMQFGRLFLVGDAAHIVPPTGAKGLNLAARDVRNLWQACCAFFQEKDQALLNAYSENCLKHIWRAERFSWWFTTMTHKLSDDSFDRRLQLAELDYFTSSVAGQKTIAENYVGYFEN